jgi:hypothetical protein
VRLRTQSLRQPCAGALGKPSGQFDGDLAKVGPDCKVGLKKDMQNLYEAVVETDGCIRISRAVHLEKGPKVLVAVPTKRERFSFKRNCIK